MLLSGNLERLLVLAFNHSLFCTVQRLCMVRYVVSWWMDLKEMFWLYGCSTYEFRYICTEYCLYVKMGLRMSFRWGNF